ncbi:hypothetical protein KIPB_010009 [Kipferlia bialata]|uniref:Uncharacterized protein n=1 Tax=Kipferlia bialata TaxID=797122 RepID=A0A9K3D3Z9_9EUKA|nr:hypothetical protein KIPB_010009 [Kipferlia bialata]|eukprot:g10009.t1
MVGGPTPSEPKRPAQNDTGTGTGTGIRAVGHTIEETLPLTVNAQGAMAVYRVLTLFREWCTLDDADGALVPRPNPLTAREAEELADVSFRYDDDDTASFVVDLHSAIRWGIRNMTPAEVDGIHDPQPLMRWVEGRYHIVTGRVSVELVTEVMGALFKLIGVVMGMDGVINPDVEESSSAGDVYADCLDGEGYGQEEWVDEEGLTFDDRVRRDMNAPPHVASEANLAEEAYVHSHACLYDLICFLHNMGQGCWAPGGPGHLVCANKGCNCYIRYTTEGSEGYLLVSPVCGAGTANGMHSHSFVERSLRPRAQGPKRALLVAHSMDSGVTPDDDPVITFNCPSVTCPLPGREVLIVTQAPRRPEERQLMLSRGERVDAPTAAGLVSLTDLHSTGPLHRMLESDPIPLHPFFSEGHLDVSATYTGGKVYVYGGKVEADETDEERGVRGWLLNPAGHKTAVLYDRTLIRNRLLVLDMATHTWQEVIPGDTAQTQGEWPPAMDPPTHMVEYDDKVWLFGIPHHKRRCRERGKPQTWCLDPDTHIWSMVDLNLQCDGVARVCVCRDTLHLWVYEYRGDVPKGDCATHLVYSPREGLVVSDAANVYAAAAPSPLSTLGSYVVGRHPQNNSLAMVSADPEGLIVFDPVQCVWVPATSHGSDIESMTESGLVPFGPDSCLLYSIGYDTAASEATFSRVVMRTPPCAYYPYAAQEGEEFRWALPREGVPHPWRASVDHRQGRNPLDVFMGL